MVKGEMNAHCTSNSASDRQLNVPENLVVFGNASLKFLRRPTWEEWQQVMEYLAHCRKTSLQWIADAQHEGRNDFGNEAVVLFKEQLELDLRDLRAVVALEGMDIRKASLDDCHHSLVAKRIKDPEQQLEWLETARREKLSIRELAPSISCGRIVRADEQDSRKAGITTVEGVRGMFDIWAARLKDACKDWPAEKQKRLVEEIQRIGEMLAVAP
jgi:uncharacterized protein CbrC (UPF0167 family)